MPDKNMRFKQTNPKPEDLGAQIYVMHMLLIALIQTHPERDKVKTAFQALTDHFFGDLLTKLVPESYLDEVRLNIAVIEEMLA